jgi:dienelactone hydrolase
MKNMRFLILAICSVILAFSAQLFADCTTPCQNSSATCPASTLVTYEDYPNYGTCHFPGHASGCDDQRASCFGSVCKIQLQGYLYFPTTKKPKKGYPAIVFNHGSSQDYPHFPGYYCAVIDYFVKKGYVVFKPHRRGYALTFDGSIKNTGSYIDDWLNETCNGTCNTDQQASYLLQQEVGDVSGAVEYLKNNYPINPDAIAVMGHSLGGIVTIFYNSVYLTQKCGISISGAAESWDYSTYLQNDLKTAVDSAENPLFFLQPRNDVSIDPTVELSYRAGLQGHRYQAAIYSNVSYAPTGECAHVCFVSDTEEVKKWGRTTIDFLQRLGVK